MKHGSRPRKSSSCGYRNMPCVQVVSHDFSRWRKIATTCSVLSKASLVNVLNLTMVNSGTALAKTTLDVG